LHIVKSLVSPPQLKDDLLALERICKGTQSLRLAIKKVGTLEQTQEPQSITMRHMKHLFLREPLNKSFAMSQAWIRDGLLGEKRSCSRATARIFNDADRPKTGLDRARGLVQRFLSSWIVVVLAVALDAQAQPASASAPTVAASAPRSATATTATKALSPHIIYRWTDANGRVQYSQQVPEDRKHTARALDGSKINIVKSERPTASTVSPANPAPAAPVIDSASSDPSAASRSTAGLSAREQCEAAWREYEASLACFADNRQTIRTQSGVRSVPNSEAAKNCRDVPKPSASC
jgi:Domain of unknown function (DUF4124)